MLHDHYAAYPFLQDEDIDIDSFLSPHDYYVTTEREEEKPAILVLTPEYHGHIVGGLGRRVVDEIEARADDGEVVYVLTHIMTSCLSMSDKETYMCIVFVQLVHF